LAIQIVTVEQFRFDLALPGSSNSPLPLHTSNIHRVAAVQAGALLRKDAAAIAAELLVDLNEFFSELAVHCPESVHLERSIQDNLYNIFSMLERDISAVEVEPPPSALFWPRQMAHEAVSVDLLNRIYYVGSSMIWHKWLFPAIVANSTDTTELSDSAQYAYSQLFTYLDRAALRVSQAFENERARSHEAGNRGTTQTVKDILAGREVARLRLARLSYDLTPNHTAFICWTDNDTDEYTRLDELARRLTTLVPGVPNVWVAPSSHEVWGWVQLRSTSRRKHLLTEVARLCADWPTPIHVAFGEAAEGVNGFRQSHQDALRAQRFISAGRRTPPTVTSYTDVALLSLLTTDRKAAEQYARRQLGDLGRDAPELSAIRLTVKEFLRTRGSYARTAEALMIHRNTVLHRIQKAESLTGRTFDNSAQEVYDALLIVEWLEGQP
jgi:hypothetical protein